MGSKLHICPSSVQKRTARMKIVFATGNANKLNEILAVIPSGMQLLGLKDVGIDEEIPEDHQTLEENALQKAEFVFKRTGLACFADDTGLEVEALNGAPGVYSARYAGPEKNAEANMAKVLGELSDKVIRKARFRTVIALVGEQGQQTFEGSVEGEILLEKSGGDGFGYDPIFQPEGEKRSFAEMTIQEKNSMSHRSRAFQKLLAYLKAGY